MIGRRSKGYRSQELQRKMIWYVRILHILGTLHPEMSNACQLLKRGRFWGQIRLDESDTIKVDTTTRLVTWRDTSEHEQTNSSPNRLNSCDAEIMPESLWGQYYQQCGKTCSLSLLMMLMRNDFRWLIRHSCRASRLP